MNFQFTHPHYLLLLPLGLGAVGWLVWISDVQINPWRRWLAMVLRGVVLSAVVLAMAGLQWLRPEDGMNVFFLLDRSQSVPSGQQEIARQYVNQASAAKKKPDTAGLLVFATEAAIEFNANAAVDVKKIQAVIGTERTDLAAAVRLGTAAFPERGQKRLVVMTDGNENVGDALGAVQAARPLGVTVDVLPLGVRRSNDVVVQKLSLPPKVKEGQTFEGKIFIHSDAAQSAKFRLYRDDRMLGEKDIDLASGKNLYTFPDTLRDPGLHSYRVEVDAPHDSLPQNNRATAFVTVQGEPRILVVSAQPDQDATLVSALGSTGLKIKATGAGGMPDSLEQLQDYDAIFISNLAAGDLGDRLMKFLESAVRDFGVGLVCVGGDQTYAAGAYRGTPLEATLPVNMELDSKKVLPPGAVVLVMHGMEFGNGNQVARDCAIGVLEALGAQDELGVVLWDGTERWLIPLQKAGDKVQMRRDIAGMNQGDLPSFQGVMEKGYAALRDSHASLKHMIVFSDGDPGAPSQDLMNRFVGDKITVSTVLISGHAGPQTMQEIAQQGGGRFYDVQSPADLPQIFIKEAMVILKSAISEEPFRPRLVSAKEPIQGIGADEYPTLLGYVCTTPKDRAELPLLTSKGDPLLAHWQYGLGRSAAFTSDAQARWAREWLGWPKYRQFWSQVARWSIRRLQSADMAAEVTIDKGEGLISVEAIDKEGNYRNFLNLQAVVVSPKGERQTVRLGQTGPGHYESRFPTKETGSYVLSLMDYTGGKLQGMQRLGASVNYSPEYNTAEPNFPLLRQLAEAGGGRVLTIPASPFPGDPVNPYLHDRRKTFQPLNLFEPLLKLAILLFVLDVGVRRIQIGHEEWRKAAILLRRWIFFWKGDQRPAETDESLAQLLARRDEVRSRQAGGGLETRPELFQPKQVVAQPFPGAESEPGPVKAPESVPSPVAEPPPAEQTSGTTSRLLAAKRRAQRKME